MEMPRLTIMRIPGRYKNVDPWAVQKRVFLHIVRMGRGHKCVTCTNGSYALLCVTRTKELIDLNNYTHLR